MSTVTSTTTDCPFSPFSGGKGWPPHGFLMLLLSHLSVSVFASVRDNAPLAMELAWPGDFAEWRETADKESVPLWSPVTYREGGFRSKSETEQNIATCSALVFDYDNEGEGAVTLDRAEAVWAPWEHVLYTTYADGLIKPPKYTGKPRFRVVLPLKRPVTTGEFRRVWAWAHQFAAAASAPFDPLADPGRLYYVPTHRPGAPPEYRHHSGAELLDPDEVLAIFAGPVAAAPRTPTGSFSPLPALPEGTRTGIFSGIERTQQEERLDLIETRCAFMRHCRDDAATLPQPEWYAWLSVVARCKDAETHAHTIGAAHPGYSEEETTDTLNRARTSSGPRTCANIRSMSAACRGCPENVTSPVLLGRPDPATAVEAAVAQVRAEAAAAAAEAATVADQQAAARGVVRSQLETDRAEAEAFVAQATLAEAAASASLELRYGVPEAQQAAVRWKAETKLALQAAKEVLRAVKTAQAQAANDEAHAARLVRDAVRVAQAQAVRDEAHAARLVRGAAKAEAEAEVAARRAAATAQADPAVLGRLSIDPRTGLPKSTLLNLRRIFEGDAVYASPFFRWDTFAETLYYGSEPARDVVDTRINQDIEARYGFPSKTALVQEALVEQGRTHEFSSVQVFLDTLAWDGEERLASLLSVGFGAAGDAAFLSEAGIKFAIGAVARIYEPGCKMDTMLVLTGKQGAGKSSGIALLASEKWCGDSPLQVGEKDGLMQLTGHWFYEISELDSFRKADSARIKAFLSSRVDTYRPPYGRNPIRHPRQTVLVGTTNEEQFLNDPSGSRRFVPVAVTQVNFAWIEENRDQVWAEAVVRYRRGEIWHYAGTSAENLATVSLAHLEEDAWAPFVRDYLTRQRRAEVTLHDVLTGGLCIEVSQIDSVKKKKVAHILRALGCLEKPFVSGQGHRPYSVPESLRGAPGKPGPTLTLVVPDKPFSGVPT